MLFVCRFLCWGMLPLILLWRGPDAVAATYQFDNAIYDWPETGHRTVAAHSVILSIDGAPDISVSIFRSARLPGDVESWLIGRMDALAGAEATITDRLPVGEVRNADLSMRFSGQTVDGVRQILCAVVIAGRIELLLFEYRGVDTEHEMQALFSKYMEPLLSSLRFVSTGAAPLLGSPSPGPLDGIYYAPAGDDQIAVLGTNRFLMFSRTGYFFEGLPAGMAVPDIDYETLLRQRPDLTGTYVLDGGVLRLRYADGATDARDITIAGGRITAGSLSYEAIAPAAAGLSLDGAYQGTAGRIAFAGDGRFTSSGAPWADAAPERGIGAGSYVVEAGALVLTDGQGNVSRHSLVTIDERTIAIDGIVFRRDGA